MSNVATDLRSRYLAYIDVLNARRFDELGEYVADDVIHNDRRWKLADYQNMLRTDVAEIPDLFFDIETLVADDEHVASRILFHCTPSRPFRGHPATGKTIDFSENVFYRFEAGKIVQVWSLLDMEAVARQLG